MATTKSYKVGKTRIKLAKMLEEAILDFKINPEDLHSQIPIYANSKWDCCSWYGTGKIGLRHVDVNSWHTMSECIKNGIDVGEECDISGFEISIKIKNQHESHKGKN